MNSAIPLETAAIFFLANLYLKQYWLGICHCLFHLQALTQPVRRANRELQNKKVLPTVGFEPGTFHLRSKFAKHCPSRSDIYRAFKCRPRFT